MTLHEEILGLVRAALGYAKADQELSGPARDRAEQTLLCAARRLGRHEETIEQIVAVLWDCPPETPES
jgi:hypothetical protein